MVGEEKNWWKMGSNKKRLDGWKMGQDFTQRHKALKPRWQLPCMARVLSIILSPFTSKFQIQSCIHSRTNLLRTRIIRFYVPSPVSSPFLLIIGTKFWHQFDTQQCVLLELSITRIPGICMSKVLALKENF